MEINNINKKELVPCLKCGSKGITFFEPDGSGKPVWINGCANTLCEEFSNQDRFSCERDAVNSWNSRNTKACPFCGGKANFLNNNLLNPGTDSEYLLALWGHSSECFFAIKNTSLTELVLAWNRRVEK